MEGSNEFLARKPQQFGQGTAAPISGKRTFVPVCRGKRKPAAQRTEVNVPTNTYRAKLHFRVSPKYRSCSAK